MSTGRPFFDLDAFAVLTLILLLAAVPVLQEVRGQTTIFDEPFSYSDGTTAPGDGSWSLDAKELSPDVFSVQSDALQVTDASDGGSGGVEFKTKAIDISGFSTVDFSLDVTENGDHEDTDFVDVEFSTDGGSTFTTITDWNGNGTASHTLVGDQPSDSDWGSATVTRSGLSGSQLVLRVTMRNNGSSEDIRLDNVEVTSTPTVQFTASSGSLNEKEESTSLSVEIVDPPSGTSVSADVTFSSGSSSASASDVNSFGTKSVTFSSGAADGETQSVTVSLVGDGTAEGSETAVFDLKNVSGGSAVAGSPSQFDLTIQDAAVDHAGDVLITEIMPDPDAVSDGDGEYIELYNTTSNAIDAGSWTIDVGGDTDGLSGVTIPARGFAVLCVNSDGSENGGIQNCDLDYVNGISLNNGGETITLTDDNGNQVDAVTYADTDPWPDPSGASLVFTGTTATDDGSNWSAASRRERGFALDESGDSGSPGRGGDQQTLQPSTDVTGSAGWRLLSAPISSVTPNTLARTNLVQGISGHHPGFDANLYQWPGGTTNNVDWTEPTSATTDLTSGARGFIWYVFGVANTAETDPPPFALSFPGAPRTGNVDATGLEDGFYLLGNPYAQAYDLSDLDLSGNGFSTTVQIWDPSAGSFKTVTQSSEATDYIGPYQGFFVERASGTSKKTLTFSPDGRRADPTPLKRRSPDPARVAFQLTGTAADTLLTRDEALTLLIHPEASLGRDVYDASKLTPLSSRYATVAFEDTLQGNSSLRAVASVPSSLPEEGIELPIHLATSNADAVEQFTLAWPEWTDVPEAWTLTLWDAETDSTVDLRRHSRYTFQLGTPTKYRVRSTRRTTARHSRRPTPLPTTVPAKAADGSSRFVLRLTRGRIPVEFAGLEASVSGRVATLRWSTASETNNAGFDVEHRSPAAQHFERLGFVEGAGTTDRPRHYRYRTHALEAGRHTFRLRQVDVDGSAIYSDTVSVRVRLRRAVQVTVAPTPVRKRATATLRVRRAQEVTASLYDALGRRVRVLYEGRLPAGKIHSVSLDPEYLASGLYFLRVTGETFETTRRIPIVR